MSKSVRDGIIECLASGEFVSGEALGKQFGVSRAAISKHIKALSDMGLDVFRVTGKGYRLSSPIELLSVDKIVANLADEYPKPEVEVHYSIDSTNSYLMKRLPNNLSPGFVCLAEHQSQGRGRRGKQWQSPYGSHIYMSMYWPLDKGMSEAMGLSLVAGLAVSDCVNIYASESATVKWPNDIYLQGKKVAGVLVELEGQGFDNSHAVIGIGLNINMPKQSAELIDQPWTDMGQYMDDVPHRNAIAATLIEKLINRLGQLKRDGLSSMLEEWRQKDFFKDKSVEISAGDQIKPGTCRGINEQGALLLEVDGKIEPIFGGEVSLRAGE